MAKDNCMTKLRLIHLILILLGIFGSGVAAWVSQKAETKAIAKEVSTLDIEGSKPAIMRVEQKEGFREILKRLPE